MAELNDSADSKNPQPMKMTHSMVAPAIDVFYLRGENPFLGCGEVLLALKMADLDGRCADITQVAEKVVYQKKILGLNWDGDSLIVVQ